MTLEEFVKGFAEQFEDTDASLITATCDFQDLDEWGSLSVILIIAFAKTAMNKNITSKEIRSCTTVEELYNLINAK